MVRVAEKPKSMKMAKRRGKHPTHAHSSKAHVDNADATMKHAVAKTLITSIDHAAYDLGYSFYK